MATIVTFLYLLSLARKTELSRFMRHTIMAMGALILVDCYAILTEVLSDQDWVELSSFWVGWLVAAIFLCVACVFYLFRRTLLKSAAYARQYWHFCSPLP